MKLRNFFTRSLAVRPKELAVAPVPTTLLLENFVLPERDWEAFFALVDSHASDYRYTCGEEDTPSGERDFLFDRFEAEGMSDRLALLQLKLAVLLRWG